MVKSQCFNKQHLGSDFLLFIMIFKQFHHIENNFTKSFLMCPKPIDEIFISKGSLLGEKARMPRAVDRDE